MIKTLRLSFSLRNTYRVNSILYSIRRIPLIGKIIPGTVYQIQGFKIFANILSVMWEIVSAFLGKIIYFLFMVAGVVKLYGLPVEAEAGAVLHILLILSIIGATLNTYLFNPTKDKYYAMVLLGMNAGEYTIINYFYAILKVFAGFTLCSFILGSWVGLSFWQSLLIPFFVTGVKMTFASKALWDYERTGTVNNENKLGKLAWVVGAVLLAVAYGLPFIHVIIPENVSVILMCFCMVTGLISVHKILTFKDYRMMYKELLVNSVVLMDASAIQNIQKESKQKKISTDRTISSNREGLEYLNELFIKRHQKLLWKSVEKISFVVVLLVLVMIVLFFVNPEAKADVNGALMTYLPYMVFVMYLINRGAEFTQVLFFNCDHSLLTYPFYKERRSILKLFQIRLREIIKVNLLPAVTIGTGLMVLLYASGGTANPLHYVVLFVSVICMSIFFSVHYLMLYYLLQPYNADTEIKSGTYKIISTITYIVCYLMLQFRMPTLMFGVMTIVFCVIYCIVASVLVYSFAPKTFKIRV